MGNPLANPDTAGLPPAVSDVPHVISTPDPVASAAYAALAHALAQVLDEVRSIRVEQAADRATLATVYERVSTLGNGMHSVLARLENAPAATQQAARQPSQVWDAAAVELAYRAALDAHQISFDPTSGLPDLKGRLTFGALYQLMACEPPSGPLTSAQTAVQGNGREAYPAFADARRLWALKYQELKPSQPDSAALIAKRAVLEWLALPAGQQRYSMVPRYRLIAHGGVDFGYLLTLVPDGHADPDKYKQRAEALLLRVRAVVDPGAAITKLA